MMSFYISILNVFFYEDGDVLYSIRNGDIYTIRYNSYSKTISVCINNGSCVEYYAPKCTRVINTVYHITTMEALFSTDWVSFEKCVEVLNNKKDNTINESRLLSNVNSILSGDSVIGLTNKEVFSKFIKLTFDKYKSLLVCNGDYYYIDNKAILSSDGEIIYSHPPNSDLWKKLLIEYVDSITISSLYYSLDPIMLEVNELLDRHKITSKK